MQQISVYETWHVIEHEGERWVSIEEIECLPGAMPKATRDITWAAICANRKVPMKWFHDNGQPSKIRYGNPRVPEWAALFLAILAHDGRLAEVIISRVLHDSQFREAGLAIHRLGGPEALKAFATEALTTKT